MKLKQLIVLTFIIILSTAGCGGGAKFDEEKAADETVAVSVSRNNFTNLPTVTSAMFDKSPLTIYYWNASTANHMALDICTAHEKKLGNDLQCKGYTNLSTCVPLELEYIVKAGNYEVTSGELYSKYFDYMHVK